jgi:hypothetical protein
MTVRHARDCTCWHTVQRLHPLPALTELAGLSTQETPWLGTRRMPAPPGTHLRVPASEPSAKRLRTLPQSQAAARAPAPPATGGPAPGSGSAVPDIMAFFAERADRAQGLEGVVAALRGDHAQLSARLAEQEAAARAHRARHAPRLAPSRARRAPHPVYGRARALRRCTTGRPGLQPAARRGSSARRRRGDGTALRNASVTGPRWFKLRGVQRRRPVAATRARSVPRQADAVAAQATQRAEAAQAARDREAREAALARAAAHTAALEARARRAEAAKVRPACAPAASVHVHVTSVQRAG